MPSNKLCMFFRFGDNEKSWFACGLTSVRNVAGRVGMGKRVAAEETAPDAVSPPHPN